MRVLFLCAHADDAEFCCGNTEVILAKKGHELIIACMTGDEYGTTRDEFKGKRIARIREKEMECAARKLGARLDWLGFIDGYLPFNKKSFTVLKNYIKEINPDVIFAPEPLFTLDFHTDHVTTGKLIYLVLKQMKNPPPLLYFHTFKANFYFPCIERKQALENLSCHVSQGMNRKTTHVGQKIYQFLYGLWAPKCWLAEGYRLVQFKPNESHFSPLRKLIYWFSKAVNNFSLPGRDHYRPTPEELGLV
ncbi:MAG: PIG-L deacetylase family protein [Candidatus Helarchaeota archaeon]